MADHCFSADELADILEMPEGDARREHLGTCPRCRAVLAEYRAFLAGEAEAGDDQYAEADGRLRAALQREIFGDAHAPAGAEPRPRGRFFQLLTLRPALTLAALLLAILAVDTFRRGTDRGGVVLRQSEGGSAAESLEALPTELAGDGGVLFHWSGTVVADAFEIQIFDQQLEELGRFPASGDSLLVLPLATLRQLLGDSAICVWRVIALRNDDEVLRSRPRSFELLPEDGGGAGRP
jgi:hypothetical protein